MPGTDEQQYQALAQLFADGAQQRARAVGRLDGPEGPVAVSAAALFIQVPLEHFVAHGAAEHVQQAIDDRAAGGPAWRPEAQRPPRELNP